MQLDLVKLVASNKPLIAGVKVSERITAIIKVLLSSPRPTQVCLRMLIIESIHAFYQIFQAVEDLTYQLMLICLLFKNFFSKMQDLAIMESMQSALENVVSAVFDGSNQFGRNSSEIHVALCRIFEGYL